MIRKLVVASVAALLLMSVPALAQMPVTIFQPTFSASPPVAVTAATFTSGESEGGLITIPSLFRPNGPGTGVLQNILVTDHAAQTGGLTLVLFGADPSSSTITNGQAVAIAQADESKIIGSFQLSCATVTGVSTPGLCTSANISLFLRLTGSACVNGQGTCYPAYVALVAAASRTQGATADLSLTLAGPED